MAQTLFVLLLLLHLCNGFYLPGSYMHTYSTGEDIFVKVNSLTSIETELPFTYYSLPYCQSPNGIKKSAENLGELLMGDQIDNSPYRFHMNLNESLFLCVTKPLNEDEVKVLKQRTRNFVSSECWAGLHLPAMRFVEQNGVRIQWTGFPVGFKTQYEDEVYIINHLKFKVLVHEYEDMGASVLITGDEGMGVVTESNENKGSGFEIVGFEIVPCSIKRNADAMVKLNMYAKVEPVETYPIGRDGFQVVREQECVAFTYEVEFMNSDIRWPSRWDAYLKIEGARVHWFSILNSLIVIFFLACILFVIFLRTVRRDRTRYEELDKEAQAQMNEELSG